ncbi:hypothetical protein ACJJTC_008176 [Scirpophaga incertulas]
MDLERELETFKRRMIRTVSWHLQKNKPLDEFWENIQELTNYDCKDMWSRMRTITLKKLSRLFEADDDVTKVEPTYRMTDSDWLFVDLIIVHEDVDLIEKMSEEAKTKLFDLVLKNDVEGSKGEELAEQWANIVLEYNTEGRQCSPMLLQRRWYQVKERTRHAFYDFWNQYKGNPRLLPKCKVMPDKLQSLIARWFPHIITVSWTPWNQLLSQDMLTLPDDLERIGLTTCTCQRGHDESSAEVKPDGPKPIEEEEPFLEMLKLAHNYSKLGCAKESDGIDLECSVTIKEEPQENNASNMPFTSLAILAEQLDARDSKLLQRFIMDEGKITNVEISDKLDSEFSTSKPVKEEYAIEIVKSEPLDFEMNNDEETTTNSNEDIADNNKSINAQHDHHEGINPEQVTPDKNISIELSLECNEEMNSKQIKQENGINCDSYMEVDSIDCKDASSDQDLEMITAEDKCALMLENNLDIQKVTVSIENLDSTNNTTNSPDVAMKSIIENTVKQASDNIKCKETNKPPDITLEGSVILESIEATVPKDGVESNKSTSTSDNKNKGTVSPKADSQKYINGSVIDPKLLKITAVYTTKLEDMRVFRNTDLHKVCMKGILEEAIIESKPTCFNQTEEEELGEEEFRVDLSNKIFKKPTIYQYNPVQICKNPDFNTRLKRLTLGFSALPHNKILLKRLKPLTIDLSKAFEHKLINGTMYLKASSVASVVSNDTEVSSQLPLEQSANQDLKISGQRENSESIECETNVPDIEDVSEMKQVLDPVIGPMITSKAKEFKTPALVMRPEILCNNHEQPGGEGKDLRNKMISEESDKRKEVTDIFTPLNISANITNNENHINIAKETDNEQCISAANLKKPVKKYESKYIPPYRGLPTKTSLWVNRIVDKRQIMYSLEEILLTTDSLFKMLCITDSENINLVSSEKMDKKKLQRWKKVTMYKHKFNLQSRVDIYQNKIKHQQNSSMDTSTEEPTSDTSNVSTTMERKTKQAKPKVLKKYIDEKVKTKKAGNGDDKEVHNTDAIKYVDIIIKSIEKDASEHNYTKIMIAKSNDSTNQVNIKDKIEEVDIKDTPAPQKKEKNPIPRTKQAAAKRCCWAKRKILNRSYRGRHMCPRICNCCCRYELADISIRREILPTLAPYPKDDDMAVLIKNDEANPNPKQQAVTPCLNETCVITRVFKGSKYSYPRLCDSYSLRRSNNELHNICNNIAIQCDLEDNGKVEKGHQVTEMEINETYDKFDNTADIADTFNEVGQTIPANSNNKILHIKSEHFESNIPSPILVGDNQKTVESENSPDVQNKTQTGNQPVILPNGVCMLLLPTGDKTSVLNENVQLTTIEHQLSPQYQNIINVKYNEVTPNKDAGVIHGVEAYNASVNSTTKPVQQVATRQDSHLYKVPPDMSFKHAEAYDTSVNSTTKSMPQDATRQDNRLPKIPFAISMKHPDLSDTSVNSTTKSVPLNITIQRNQIFKIPSVLSIKRVEGYDTSVNSTIKSVPQDTTKEDNHLNKVTSGISIKRTEASGTSVKSTKQSLPQDATRQDNYSYKIPSATSNNTATANDASVNSTKKSIPQDSTRRNNHLNNFPSTTSNECARANDASVNSTQESVPQDPTRQNNHLNNIQSTTSNECTRANDASVNSTQESVPQDPTRPNNHLNNIPATMTIKRKKDIEEFDNIIKRCCTVNSELYVEQQILTLDNPNRLSVNNSQVIDLTDTNTNVDEEITNIESIDPIVDANQSNVSRQDDDATNSSDNLESTVPGEPVPTHLPSRNESENENRNRDSPVVISVSSRNSLLSDLMLISGISDEDVTTAPSDPPSISEAPVGTTSYSNANITNTNAISINVSDLITINSYNQLRVASQKQRRFFKLDLNTGHVTDINLTIRKADTSAALNLVETSEHPETVIDLTGDTEMGTNNQHTEAVCNLNRIPTSITLINHTNNVHSDTTTNVICNTNANQNQVVTPNTSTAGAAPNCLGADELVGDVSRDNGIRRSVPSDDEHSSSKAKRRRVDEEAKQDVDVEEMAQFLNSDSPVEVEIDIVSDDDDDAGEVDFILGI